MRGFPGRTIGPVTRSLLRLSVLPVSALWRALSVLARACTRPRTRRARSAMYRRWLAGPWHLACGELADLGVLPALDQRPGRLKLRVHLIDLEGEAGEHVLHARGGGRQLVDALVQVVGVLRDPLPQTHRVRAAIPREYPACFRHARDNSTRIPGRRTIGA